MKGIDATFEAIVAEHHRSVLRVCRSVLRDDHLGSDAAQETFLRLWRRLAGDGVPEPLGAWLKRVAVTTSLDQLRNRSRARRREALSAAERDAHPAPGDDLAAEELRRRFERALEELPEGQRTVFLLRHSAEMPLAEVAETLGVAPTTIKTQFARACLRLQSSMRAFDPRGGSNA